MILKGETHLDGFRLNVETDRLLLRPYQKEDYENWLHQFEQRKPSQYKHDQGKLDMSGMRFECIRKGFIYENGEWTDHRIYVINSLQSQ